MTYGLIAAILALLGVLTLVSYVERIYTEMGKFLSREFQENIEAFEQTVEKRLKVARERISLSMAVLEQCATAAIAVLLAFAALRDRPLASAELAQIAVLLILIIIVFNRVIPFVLFSRTRGEWLNSYVWLLRGLIYLALPVTLIIGFCLSVATLTKEHTDREPEHPSEAVDALIEAGQEEGILEGADRDLIHSVVEFSDKVVREVMTPRPEICAVPQDTTVEQFTEMLRTRPYSRVPVYEDTIDRILGIVFAHDVLQVADTEARTRTVRTLMKREVRYVPESKRVSDLLREMQRDNVHMEIVVDEYGAVAGVVTIEDLVEEIVGEIRDEHEASADVLPEGNGAFLVPGNMDVDRLDDLFDVRLGDVEATTVAGLVSEAAGHIPRAGELVQVDGLRFEILESSEYRVQRLRVTRSAEHESDLPSPEPRQIRA
jgi:CBS domain containing-hemolysin-like protein